MKELAVEVKMVYLVVAKVVYMEVEMVEKVVVEMGCLVFLGGREVEEGGMGMLWLLEMEEEMEGRMVEEFVVEIWVAQGRRRRLLVASLLVAAGNKEEEEEK